MTDVRSSGTNKGCAIFWIVLFIILLIGTVVAVKMGIINPGEIFQP